MTSGRCYVSMPFGEQVLTSGATADFDLLYRESVRPAVEAAGLTPLRVDTLVAAGSVDQAVVEVLARAEVMIADLSSGNPYVFYELGMRHALAPADDAAPARRRVRAAEQSGGPADLGLLGTRLPRRAVGRPARPAHGPVVVEHEHRTGRQPLLPAVPRRAARPARRPVGGAAAPRAGRVRAGPAPRTADTAAGRRPRSGAGPGGRHRRRGPGRRPDAPRPHAHLPRPLGLGRLHPGHRRLSYGAGRQRHRGPAERARPQPARAARRRRPGGGGVAGADHAHRSGLRDLRAARPD